MRNEADRAETQAMIEHLELGEDRATVQGRFADAALFKGAAALLAADFPPVPLAVAAPAAAPPAAAVERHRHKWANDRCVVAGCDAKPRPRKPAQPALPGAGS